MKKAMIGLMFLTCLSAVSSGQVFNTGHTLKKGSFSAGFEPVYMLDQKELILFLHGGYGLSRGVDLGLSFGVLTNNPYFGADLEYAVSSNFSLTGGFHSYADFGVDAAVLFTMDINRSLLFTTGGDMDINFGNETDLLLWIPLSFEIALRRNMNFILEAELAVTRPAYNLMGGGLAFYF